jgi:HD-GYP domain-containing protein (c-di-GMP phosphodiesterase class II)
MPSAPIFIVHSNPYERMFLETVIGEYFETRSFSNCDIALKSFSRPAPAAVVVDEMAIPSGAYEFLRILRREAALAAIPVAVCSSASFNEAIGTIRSHGGDAYLSKSWGGERIVDAVSAVIDRSVEASWEALPEPQSLALRSSFDALRGINGAIVSGTPLPYKEIKQACLPMVKLIYENNAKDVMDAVRQHDNYTYAHSFRVAMLLSIIGYALGLDREEQAQLASGGLLHDAGKMVIPLKILTKAGPLTAEEWGVMKMHVMTTVDFLAGQPDLPKGTIIIASQHHEKLDGSGYPNGLKGSEINDVARMAGIADIYGALTDRRTYKPAMPAEKAFAIMSDQMSAHIDTGFLKVFRQVILDNRIDV